MISKIPVHPMTFRILVKENDILDVDPVRGVLIQGNSNSMLNDLIKFGNVDKSDVTKSVANRFTMLISIRHPSKIDNPINVGFYLHKIYMRKANQFIHAQVLTGETAMQAIRNFCALYEIIEDDIPMETLGRLWRRYYYSINHGKKSNKSLLNIAHNVLKNNDNALLSDVEKFRLSDDICNQFIKSNIDAYFNSRKEFNVSLMNQTRCYTLSSIFKMTHKEISKLFDVGRRSTTRRIETFKYFLLSDDMLAESYENTVKAFL